MLITHDRTDDALTIDGGRGARGDLKIVALSVLIFMTDGFDIQVIAFVGTSILKTFNQPLSALGPLLTWGVMGILVGAVILGALGDRIGRRIPLILSLTVFSVGTFATCAVKQFDQLAGLRLLTGIGLGGAMPSLYALCAESAPAKWRALTVTLAACGNPLGAAIGGLICAEVVPSNGWRVVFEIAGLFSLALIPLVWSWIPRSVFSKLHGDATTERVGPRSKRLLLQYLAALFRAQRLLGTPLVWLTCFSAVLTAYFLVSWTPALAERAGLSAKESILAGALLNVGAIFGGALLSRLIDKRGPYRVLGVGFAMGGLLIIGIGWSWHVPLLFLANVLLVGTVAFGSTACIGTFATLFYPEEIRGIGVGFAMAFAQIGGVAGPFLGGILVGENASTEMLFLAVAGNTLLASLAVYALARWAGEPTRSHQRMEVGIAHPD